MIFCRQDTFFFIYNFCSFHAVSGILDRGSDMLNNAMTFCYCQERLSICIIFGIEKPLFTVLNAIFSYIPIIISSLTWPDAQTTQVNLLLHTLKSQSRKIIITQDRTLSSISSSYYFFAIAFNYLDYFSVRLR